MLGRPKGSSPATRRLLSNLWIRVHPRSSARAGDGPETASAWPSPSRRQVNSGVRSALSFEPCRSESFVVCREVSVPQIPQLVNYPCTRNEHPSSYIGESRHLTTGHIGI